MRGHGEERGRGTERGAVVGQTGLTLEEVQGEQQSHRDVERAEGWMLEKLQEPEEM